MYTKHIERHFSLNLIYENTLESQIQIKKRLKKSFVSANIYSPIISVFERQNLSFNITIDNV